MKRRAFGPSTHAKEYIHMPTNTPTEFTELILFTIIAAAIILELCVVIHLLGHIAANVKHAVRKADSNREVTTSPVCVLGSPARSETLAEMFERMGVSLDDEHDDEVAVLRSMCVQAERERRTQPAEAERASSPQGGDGPNVVTRRAGTFVDLIV